MKSKLQCLFVLVLCIATCLAAKAVSDDMTIKGKLFAMIASHKEFDNRLFCDVSQGVITLEGEVKNYGDRAFAERVATNIPGVYRVRNLLVVDI